MLIVLIFAFQTHEMQDLLGTSQLRLEPESPKQIFIYPKSTRISVVRCIRTILCVYVDAFKLNAGEGGAGGHIYTHIEGERKRKRKREREKESEKLRKRERERAGERN